MRVALLSRAAWPLHAPGGMERAVHELARHLQEAGVETVLFTRPATRAGEFPGEVETVPYAGFPLGAHGRVLDRSLNYPGFARRVGRVVAERVRGGTLDVVYAQGLTALGYGLLRRREAALRAPLVMNPQGMEEHKARGLKRLALVRLRRLSRLAAALADRVIATDAASRGEVLALLGVPRSKVAVIPNGVDVAAIDAATPEAAREQVAAAFPALSDAEPLLLSVGRIERYKGLDDTLRALQLLRAEGRLPERWAWAVAGDGPHREALACAARRAGFAVAGPGGSGRGSLAGSGTALPGSGALRVHLLGSVGEPLLHALYERADLFVHATHYEGSSLVTLEAMAHGLPVVATRAGGIPDKVVPGETGLLAEPRDPESLALALAQALALPDARERLGRRGRERAERLFSWQRIARQTIELFEELLREARA